MQRKNVILGGLIAGAFLLPTLASAGKVTGVCSNCHTMHNSQNGIAINSGGTNDTLLLGTGCLGCHAISGDVNGTNGRDTSGTIHAPQVHNTGSTSGYINNAGYFRYSSAGGTDIQQHNVLGIMGSDQTMILATATNAPGDTGGVGPGPGGLIGLGSGTTPNLSCSSCHGSSGGHHGSGSGVYRLLSGVNGTTSSQTDFGAIAATATTTSGTRSEVAYNAADMNLFCANCHGLFHTAANQDGTTLNDGVWIRHPTDVSVATQKGLGATMTPSLQEGNAISFVGNDAVVVGTTAGIGTDVIMCLSCHVPHGGPYKDLLSFPMDDTTTPKGNSAGDSYRSVGCETCHSYGSGAGAGM